MKGYLTHVASAIRLLYVFDLQVESSIIASRQRNAIISCNHVCVNGQNALVLNT